LSGAQDPVSDKAKRERRTRVRRRRFYVLAAFMVVLAGIGWWRWQNAWTQLEGDEPVIAESRSGLPPRVSPEIMDRQIVYKVDPVYPDAARRAGIQGLVVLNAVIAPDGRVKRLRPVAGPGLLAQSALDAVQSWRYIPYRSGGQAVEVETTISVDFRLR
jgi:protein TonB